MGRFNRANKKKSVIYTLSRHVFKTRTATGSELISLLSCPHTTTFALLSIFSPLEMSSIKIWETIRSSYVKCSLPVAVRVSKSRVLKLPNINRPRSFWSEDGDRDLQVQHRKSTIHGLPVTLRMPRVKPDKSDWFWSQSIVFTKPFKTGLMSLDLARGPDLQRMTKGTPGDEVAFSLSW